MTQYLEDFLPPIQSAGLNTREIVRIGESLTNAAADEALGVALLYSVGDRNGYYNSLTGQNKNAGTLASTDVILSADNGTETTNYIDLGIASSGSNDPAYTAFGAGVGYLYNQSQDLVIGTATAAKPIRFFTGGTLTANVGLRLLANNLTVAPGTATPAGGTAATGLTFGTTANLGIFFGSGVPTLSAAQGSLYIRTDGSSTSTRLYVNTNGATTWTNVTTAA